MSSLERITITIDKSLLGQVDARVDGRRMKNRSHAISELVSKSLAGGAIKKALVLAGGKDAAKQLADVGGKTVLHRILEHLRSNGIREVVLAVGKGGEKIVSLFQDGAQLGINIVYSWEKKEGEGTAGAIANARQFFSEPFLLSYSDVLYNELDLQDLFEHHKKNGGVCTLALVDLQNPKGLGVVRLSGSRIVSFEEKPFNSKSSLVNAGVAVCEPAIFALLREGMKSFEKDLLPIIASKERLYGYAYSGEWFHTEDKKQLEEARKAFAKR